MTTETTSSHVERFPNIGPIAFFRALWETRDDPLARLIIKRLRIYGILLILFLLALTYLVQIYALCGWDLLSPGGIRRAPSFVLYTALYCTTSRDILLQYIIPILLPFLAWRKTIKRDESLRALPFSPSRYTFNFILPIVLFYLFWLAILIVLNVDEIRRYHAYDATMANHIRRFLFKGVIDTIYVAGLGFAASAFAVRALTMRRLTATGRGHYLFELSVPIIVFFVIGMGFKYAEPYMYRSPLPPEIPDTILYVYLTLANYAAARYFWKRDFRILTTHTFAAQEAA
ncbi:hypothetical protein KQI84_16755 [bacterium]|nr:hypothetical protein [bacterium]